MNKKRTEVTEKINLINNRKKQVYGFLTFTIIIIIILSIGAIKPSLETIVRLRSEIEKKENVLTMLETKINTLNNLSIQYLDFESTAKDLKLVYPTTGDFSLYLANIEAISENSGFELKSIRFGQVTNYRGEGSKKFDNLRPVRVQLSVIGRRQNLIPLLKNYEGMPMYPEVQTVSFNNETDDQGRTAFTITMYIYEINKGNFYD